MPGGSHRLCRTVQKRSRFSTERGKRRKSCVHLLQHNCLFSLFYICMCIDCLCSLMSGVYVPPVCMFGPHEKANFTRIKYILLDESSHKQKKILAFKGADYR